jgi:hypothetical protein
MTKVSVNTLKNWFKKGLKPLEVQYASWLDSYWHKDESIPASTVSGLTDLLNGIPSAATLTLLEKQGIITKESTSDLSTVPGNGALIVFVVSIGLFVYRSTGTPNGTTVFQASDAGVWELKLAVGLGGGETGDFAPKESPTFTGIPIAPTPEVGTNTKQIATTEFVQSMIAALIGSAPDALNTLNELAQALGDNENFASEVIAQLATLAAKNSPAFTGIPIAPTAGLGTSTTQLATTEFVKQEIDETPFDLGSVSSGTVIFNGNHKNQRIVLTGNVTLDYTGLIAGREYTLRIERVANTTLTFASNKWECPGGTVMAPKLTDPTTNGSSPSKAIDYLVFKFIHPTELPGVTLFPDKQKI